jgi:hypothetical protein
MAVLPKLVLRKAKVGRHVKFDCVSVNRDGAAFTRDRQHVSLPEIENEPEIPPKCSVPGAGRQVDGNDEGLVLLQS